MEDAVEMHGGSRVIIKFLNQFGVVASTIDNIAGGNLPPAILSMLQLTHTMDLLLP